MLVFTRRIGESIIIGADVEVTVLRTNARKVLIGIKTLKNASVVQSDDSSRNRLGKIPPSVPSIPPSSK